MNVSPQRVLDAAVLAGDIPGAAAAIVTPSEQTIFCAGVRSPHIATDNNIVTSDTVYDLASLTKVLATTRIVADAVDRGLLRLTDDVHRWPGQTRPATVEDILRHEGGTPAHVRLFETAAGTDIVAGALAVPSVAEPGAQTLYSDISMIVLGAFLEERLGAPIDALHARLPKTSDTLQYVQLSKHGHHPRLDLTAPTERCPWRNRIVHGQVHDENAYMLDGVAAHAGLFGSLQDVIAVCRAMLSEIANRRSLFTFTTVETSNPERRPIGFDRVTDGGSTGGALPASAVGHLGFTGTSVWFDVDASVAYILLTNRVHETRDNNAIRALRQTFHRAAALHAQRAT
jgi:serine-type D-Ala-D-Ala carboxypeptidase